MTSTSPAVAGTTGRPADEHDARRAWQTLFISSVAIFLAGMDVTIVGVALPGISNSFPDVSSSVLAWLFTANNVTFAALLLLGGRLGDRVGHKTAFLAGAAVFSVASLVAAVAPSIEILIGARVVQAVGSAVIYPASLALVMGSFPIERRSTAIGVWGAMAGLGGVVAPTIGALLVQWAGWRAVFFVNLPFVAAAMIGGWRVLDGRRTTAMGRFDPVAVPLAAISIGALVLAIVQGAPWGWTDQRTLACVVAAAVLMAAFLVRSVRHPFPLLDLAMFRIRTFAVGTLVQVVATAPMFGWLVLMPTFLQNVWGWSPLASGLALAPQAAVAASLSPIAGRIADRTGHRALIATGCGIGALGALWWVLFVGDDSNYLTGMLPGLVLTGIGASAGVATCTGAAMSRIPPRYYSMSGAARTTIFQLGLGVGIAVAVAVVNAGNHLTVTPFRTIWAIAAIGSIAAAALMATLFPSKARPGP